MYGTSQQYEYRNDETGHNVWYEGGTIRLAIPYFDGFISVRGTDMTHGRTNDLPHIGKKKKGISF